MVFFAGIALVTLFAACEGKKETTESGAYDDNGNLRVGVIWRRFDDDFQAGFRSIMENEAKRMGKFALNMQDGEFDVSKANNKLDTLIASGYQYLALLVIEPNAAEYMMNKCKQSNLPVVFFNTQPRDDVMASYNRTWYVGARPEESGTYSAKVLVDYWKNNTAKADKNGDGKLQLIIIQGEIGHNDVALRTQAYHDTLQAAGIPYEVVKQDTAEWLKDKAQDKMQAYLTELGEKGIEGVLCNSDGMAIGVVNACLQNGFNTGPDAPFIPVCGIDATIEALEAMKTGALLGTCLNDRAAQSQAVLNIIRSLSEGNENITTSVVNVPGSTVDGKYIWVPYKGVDASNLDSVLEEVTGQQVQ
ncbi:MAG: galactose ABC transporter substrate-binding protein [Dysgonamonadaceae bacterium]|nr:galactose ABC transporter substrate-binding protein [Dysgonamonadaceae bacterium]